MCLHLSRSVTVLTRLCGRTGLCARSVTRIARIHFSYVYLLFAAESCLLKGYINYLSYIVATSGTVSASAAETAEAAENIAEYIAEIIETAACSRTEVGVNTGMTELIF